MKNSKIDKTKKINEAVKKYLKDKKLIKFEEPNIIDMSKACIAASILRYALNARFENQINNVELSKFFKALDDFNQDKIILFWENGIVKFTRLVPINEITTDNQNEEQYIAIETEEPPGVA